MFDQGRDFQEVGHSGGQVIVHVQTTDGRRRCWLTWTGSRPVPTVVAGVWALPQGIPVATVRFAGIGRPSDTPPTPGCYEVFLASDSQGRFGHECPGCKGYWRSGPAPLLCPYCSTNGNLIAFLTQAQRRYIKQYCDHMTEAIHSEHDGDYMIDMDAVADAVGKDGEKPPFYYAEQTQQNRYSCEVCGEFNDILGRFGYCA